MADPDLEPVELSAALEDYYRGMLRAHADDPSTGACVICNWHRCPDYTHALTRLLAAGVLYEEP